MRCQTISAFSSLTRFSRYHYSIVCRLADSAKQDGLWPDTGWWYRLRFYLPVRAGDILIASPKIKDIAEKEGKSGTAMLCNFETSYLNQNGDLVARAYQTFIAR